jgi:hypothetical protein
MNRHCNSTFCDSSHESFSDSSYNIDSEDASFSSVNEQDTDIASFKMKFSQQRNDKLHRFSNDQRFDSQAMISSDSEDFISIGAESNDDDLSFQSSNNSMKEYQFPSPPPLISDREASNNSFNLASDIRSSRLPEIKSKLRMIESSSKIGSGDKVQDIRSKLRSIEVRHYSSRRIVADVVQQDTSSSLVKETAFCQSQPIAFPLPCVAEKVTSTEQILQTVTRLTRELMLSLLIAFVAYIFYRLHCNTQENSLHLKVNQMRLVERAMTIVENRQSHPLNVQDVKHLGPLQRLFSGP